MTTNFRKRQRASESCSHESVTKTVNAGIGRKVCDYCGQVSVEFANSTFAADAVHASVAVSA